MGRPAPKGAAPPGLFYGYTIIAASAALEICTAPGNPAGLSAFLEPMMADLGMTRTAISATWTGALLGASVVAPLGGLALDRFGPCAVGLVATAGLSLSLLVLSGATSGAVCGAALLGVRVAGPECLVIVGSTTVNRWWVRRRGWASVLKSSKKVAMHGFPAVASWAVGVAGWRVTLRWIAAGVAVAGSLASTALSLDPESLGVFPDGDVSPPSPTIAAVEAACSGPSGKPTRRGGVATSQGGDRGAAAVRKRVGGGATVRDASNDRAGVKGISETAAGSEGSIDAREGSSSAPTDTEKGSVEPVWTFEEVMGEPLFWLLIGTNFVFSLFRTGVAMHRVDLYARTGIPKDQIALTTVHTHPFHPCVVSGAGGDREHLRICGNWTAAGPPGGADAGVAADWDLHCPGHRDRPALGPSFLPLWDQHCAACPTLGMPVRTVCGGAVLPPVGGGGRSVWAEVARPGERGDAGGGDGGGGAGAAALWVVSRADWVVHCCDQGGAGGGPGLHRCARALAAPQGAQAQGRLTKIEIGGDLNCSSNTTVQYTAL
eukprot:m.385890 g.385890  ORF g.385890 m.385890 type:complete len:546 (-) comp16744_c0_seq2:12-1649(-)